MKKFLASLATLAIIGSSATSVVSCGPITFARLMGRTVATDVYRGTYKSPMTNWNSAVTMQLDDSIILTNTQDTLLATDQHNNFEGDLADAWTSKDNNKTWSFHVRDNEFAAHWTEVDGSNTQHDRGVIKPEDFYNDFRYAFNPNNMSQTVGIWQTVIKHGDELNNFITQIRKEGDALYDPRFVKGNQSNEETVKSNYFIDRAIMAFNWKADMTTARNIALNVNTYDDEELKTKSFQEGQIIGQGNDTNYNLVFYLEKPAPYFESIAAFLSLAPLPDIAVDYLNFSKSGSNYGHATTDGKFGYQNIWYSGPYVVSEYNPTLKVTMVQNKDYFNQKAIKIKELDYAYIGNVDVSRQRFYFETGDISEVGIQPTDLAGWTKYVGSDYKKPNFEGANLVSRPQAGTFGMVYNYNSTIEGSANANLAISQRSTRGFIRYIFDRSRVASYYSKAMDNGSSTSTMLRNTWTSKNLVVYKTSTGQEKDYVDYMADNYFDLNNHSSNSTTSGWLNEQLAQSGLTPSNYDEWLKKYGQRGTDATKNALSDGYDTFMHNDLLGALVFVDDNRYKNNGDNTLHPRNPDLFNQYVSLIGDYSPEAESQKLDKIKTQVQEDLGKIGIHNSVSLPWLVDGSKSTTINNNVKDAIRTFNERAGDNSPVVFTIAESTDTNDYQVKMNGGQFTVINSGWVPDYADPYTFLHTLVAGGDLEAYTGFGRLFDQNFDADGQVTLTVKPSISDPNNAYQDLLNRVQHFTNQVSTIDKHEGDPNQRYQDFAKIENYAMIESMITLPLLFQLLDEPPYISYINPFTRSTYTSGQAIYRFVGVKMVPRLWNHETFLEKQQDWNNEKENYISIYPGQNGEFNPVIEGKWS